MRVKPIIRLSNPIFSKYHAHVYYGGLEFFVCEMNLLNLVSILLKNFKINLIFLLHLHGGIRLLIENKRNILTGGVKHVSKLL